VENHNPSQDSAIDGISAAGHSRRLFLLGAASVGAVALAAPAWAVESAESTVSVERRGDDIVVQAHADVRAALEMTWSTLADYDHLAEFIPGMAVSRTLSREGASAMVEQKAVAAFGPFRQNLSLLLAVEETPNESITASIVKGDFRRFDSRYDVVSLEPQRTRITYHATLDPSVPVPPSLRRQIRKQFEALVAEVARRGAQA
jgi:ribosome-associated toxin RatA of RatAB toxin-antitoxin module